jgi:hypothetical protein
MKTEERIEKYLAEAAVTHPAALRRVKKAVEKAQDAFWMVIAKSFPEVKSGDFDPMASHQFDTACEKAVEHWIAMNLD